MTQGVPQNGSPDQFQLNIAVTPEGRVRMQFGPIVVDFVPADSMRLAGAIANASAVALEQQKPLVEVPKMIPPVLG